MARQRFDKLFSAEEANHLLPKLQILIREPQVRANVLRDRVRELSRADDRMRGLDLPEMIEHYPELAPVAAPRPLPGASKVYLN